MEREDLLLKLEQERKVARTNLLNYGLPFSLRKRSILKYLPWGLKNENGERVREFRIHKPYLHTMDVLSELRLQMKINIMELQDSDNPIRIKNKIIKENVFLASKIIAVSLLNNWWKIKCFSNILAKYLSLRIHSQNLAAICQIIDEMEDAENFINSIVSLSGTDQNRTSAPKVEKMEKNKTNPEEKQ